MDVLETTNDLGETLGTEQIKLRLGPIDTPEIIEVEKSLLVRQSSYFKHMFKTGSGFRETKEEAVDLTIENPEVVKNYIAMIKHGIEDLHHRFWTRMDPRYPNPYSPDFDAIAKVYVFADYLMDPASKKLLALKFLELGTDTNSHLPLTVPTLEFVWTVYDRTNSPEKSEDMLRVALVKSLASHTDQKEVQDLLKADPDHLPEGFTDNMMLALLWAKERQASALGVHTDKLEVQASTYEQALGDRQKVSEESTRQQPVQDFLRAQLQISGITSTNRTYAFESSRLDCWRQVWTNWTFRWTPDPASRSLSR